MANRSESSDAKIFAWLMSLSPVQAQAYFWNYSSRKERKKAMKKDMQKSAMTDAQAADTDPYNCGSRP